MLSPLFLPPCSYRRVTVLQQVLCPNSDRRPAALPLPYHAQGYNKRATVLFLLQRYRESVADCRVVLELNPYHFAAAAGMGTCLRWASGLGG